ncbi:sensor histidine kinase [Bradyrhizobium sp. UFLA05-112]
MLFGAILRNLVRNLVKYTHPGGRVLVDAVLPARTSSSKSMTPLSAYPGDEIPQVFDLFACTDFSSGSDGVGLYIVRQAAGMLGHHLEITSTPLQGSRFCIVAERA